MLKIKSLFIIVAFLSTKFLFADTKMDLAIEKFNNYEMEEALKLFSEIIDEENNKEAILYKVYIQNLELTNKSQAENLELLVENFENPNPYIFSFMHYLYGTAIGKDNPDLIDLLEEYIEEDKINVLLKPHFIEALGRYNYFINEFDNSREYLEKVKIINKWQFAGEFDNISAFGYSENYAPINNPQSDAVFKNKFGADVRWFNSKDINAGEWIDFDYFFGGSNSIVYSQNFYYSELEEDLIGTLGVSGSVKVWVNDQLIFKEKKERNNGLDSYKFKIRVKKGWNRFLIQLGESEAENLNFAFRLLDNDFISKDIDNFNPEFKDYTKLSGEKIELIDDATEEYFKRKIKENPKKQIYYYLLFEHYSIQNNIEKVRLIFDDILELNPNSVFNTMCLVRIYSMIGNRTMLSQELEKLKKIENIPSSLEMLWSEAKENDNFQKLDSLYTQMEKLDFYYGDEKIIMKKVELLLAKKNWEDLFELVNKAYGKYPENYSFVNLMFLIEWNLNKNPDIAEEVLKDYLEDHNRYAAKMLLYNFYMKTSEIDNAIDIYKEIIEHKKYSVGTLFNLAKSYFNNRDYDNAKKYIMKTLEYAPYFSANYSLLGDIYKQIEEKDKSIEAYQKAIKLYPLGYNNREKLRIINNQKTLFEQMGEPDLNKKFNESPGADEFPEDNMIILHDETKSIAYENGGFEQKMYILYKVLTKSGIDLLKEYSIPGYRNQNYHIEKAEVLKKDGNIIKAEENGSQLVFTNLEEGDGVLIIYTLKTLQSTLLIQHFWDDFYFKTYYPSLLYKYTLAVEGDKKFNYTITNDSFEPKITKFENFSLYEWEKENVAKVEGESYMPKLNDVSDVLHISSINDWEEISDWYQKLSNSKSEVDYDVNKLFDEIFASDKKMSNLQKAKKIYEYIVKNIRYSSVSFRQSGLIPQKAADLVSEKIGDCKDVSTLFVALCKKADLDANLVLVNSRDNGLDAMALPSINFDHCIAQLNLGKEKYYLELTSENLPFGTIGESMINSFSLPIYKNSKEPIHLDFEKREINKVVRDTEISFENSKSVVKTKSRKFGSKASGMRYAYLYSSAKERFKKMQNAIIDDNPTLKLLKFDMLDGLEEVNKPVSYYTEFIDPTPFTEISSMSLFLYQLPWADDNPIVEFISQPERDYPLELWRFFSSELEEEKIVLNIPENKNLNGFPENVSISNQFFDYNLTFKRDNQKVICTRKFGLKKRDIEPENYALFKKDFEKLVKSDQLNIEFIGKEK